MTVTTIAQYATIATPFAGVAVAGAVGYVAKLIGQGRFVKLVEDVARDAPTVEAAVKDVEKIPAVKHAVDDFESRVRAEAARIDAATHGAIDVVAGELAKTLPAAIQDAIVAAHSSIPAAATAVPVSAPVAPVVAPVTDAVAVEAAVRVNDPAAVTVVGQ